MKNKKCKKLFITGTGTDIGKTFIAGLIVKKMYEQGLSVGYFKAAMSGNVRDKEGNLIPGDAKWVKDASGIEQGLSEMCPYVYENAYSPHLASKLEGNPVRMNQIEESFYALSKKYEYITVEGSGGILCPLSFDEEKIQLEDVVKRLQLPSIIVADSGLGTINSLVLTVEYMKNKNMPIKGIIFNNFHEGNILEEDNKYMCQKMTGIEVLACIAQGAKDIDVEIDKLVSIYE